MLGVGVRMLSADYNGCQNIKRYETVFYTDRLLSRKKLPVVLYFLFCASKALVSESLRLER
jgi:hypothetical protein